MQFTIVCELWCLVYAFKIVIWFAFSGAVSQCSGRAREQSETLCSTHMWEKEASAIETVYT